MQNDFIDGTLGTSEAQAIVSHVCRKIKNFDGDVIYTQDTHGKDYLCTLEGKKLPIIHCIKDTEGWQINRDVFAEGKCKCIAIIEKQTFGSEKLAQFLEENRYEKVTLIGLFTDISIINNAMIIKAKCHEIPVAVDSVCCAGITPESHQRALDAMGMCQIEII
jgi:Amidases related to nicotinamidase